MNRSQYYAVYKDKLHSCKNKTPRFYKQDTVLHVLILSNCKDDDQLYMTFISFYNTSKKIKMK